MTPYLQQLGEDIRTQDNRMTSFPIFQVRDVERDYGYDPVHAESHQIIWLDCDFNEYSPEESEAREQAYVDNGDEKPEEYADDYRRAFVDRYKVILSFFTERGAKEFIETNGHHLNKPSIYVDSAYRNPEWQAIREFLKNLPPPNKEIL